MKLEITVPIPIENSLPWDEGPNKPTAILLALKFDTIAQEFIAGVSSLYDDGAKQVLARSEILDLHLHDLADFFRRIDQDIKKLDSDPLAGMERVNPEDDKETRGGR